MPRLHDVVIAFPREPSPSRGEIALLARRAWLREGRPANRQRQYRREVELQLRATRHLLTREFQLQAIAASVAEFADG